MTSCPLLSVAHKLNSKEKYCFDKHKQAKLEKPAFLATHKGIVQYIENYIEVQYGYGTF